MTTLEDLSAQELRAREAALQEQYEAFRKQGLALDLTRGKPSAAQLDLSAGLDDMLAAGYRAADGTDVRNYGGLLGIPEARELGAAMLDLRPDEVLVGGNSSLSLMYQFVAFAHLHGVAGAGSAWSEEARAAGGAVKFLCPVPGYDRHFTVCEHFGIEMQTVELGPEGPDMDAVESAVAQDPLIKGIWCVPRYSNPTGHTYSDAVVERFARLARRAGPSFRILWDNAYAVHHLCDAPPPLRSLMDACREAGTEESAIVFGSTSKITYAGSGISFLGMAPSSLARFQKHLSAATIGPDKVNQLRHVRFLENAGQLAKHMERHRSIIEPKFRRVLDILEEALGGKGLATWTEPAGGYFISLDTLAGLAARVVELAATAGVKLTPAGATFPYGLDPHDRNIRLAPTFPPLEELDQAMRVVVVCIELASLQQRLAQRA